MKQSALFNTAARGGLALLALAMLGTPAYADFVQAGPRTTFSGVLQSVNEQTVAVSTPNGTVLVPAQQSEFLANGVTMSPYGLAVGTPVVVSVPAALAPQLALADLGPPPPTLNAFPGSFNSYLVTSAGPPLMTPLPPPMAPVAPVYGSVVSPVAVMPPSPSNNYPGYGSGYNAFGAPVWAQGYATNSVGYAPAPAPGYQAFEAPAYYPAPYAPPAYGSHVGMNLGGVNLSYNSYQPAYGYGPGFVPPMVAAPYGYAAYPAYPPPAPYPLSPGYGTSSVGLNLGGGVSLSYNTVQPTVPYGYGMMPAYGYAPAPVYPYGGGYSGTSINFGNGFSYSAFNPQPVVYPMGGFVSPASVTTVSLGGVSFSIASAPPPVYTAPFVAAPMYVTPYSAFAYPVLGPAVGFQSNAVMVQTSGGILSVPVAVMPAPVMAQMVFVQAPGQPLAQVPLSTALLLRQQGATIVSNPVIPSSCLMGRVAVERPSGQVVSIPLVAALHQHNGVILGAAGGVMPAHMGHFHGDHAFGFVSRDVAERAGVSHFEAERWDEHRDHDRDFDRDRGFRHDDHDRDRDRDHDRDFRHDDHDRDHHGDHDRDFRHDDHDRDHRGDHDRDARHDDHDRDHRGDHDRDARHDDHHDAAFRHDDHHDGGVFHTEHHDVSHHEAAFHDNHEGHTGPQHFAPQHGAPQHAAPQHFAPQHSAPQHFAPQHSAPQHFAPQHSAPQHFSPPQQHFSPPTQHVSAPPQPHGAPPAPHGGTSGNGGDHDHHH